MRKQSKPRPGQGDGPRFFKSQRPKIPFINGIVLVVCGLAGMSFALAALNLITDRGIVGIAKIVVISLSATAVAYGVNRLAVERGAPLAASGFKSCGIVSVVSILFVGVGLFISTHAGLTREGVEEIRLQLHGAELQRVIATRNTAAVEGNRPAGVLRSIVTDLQKHRDGELSGGTISGRQAGRGPITRFLEDKMARAQSIAGEKESGEGARQAIVGRLNALMGRFQEVLAAASRSIWVRRLELQKIHAAIDQQLALLDEAQPIALMETYATELLAGVSIPGRPDATERINAIFKSHGESLRAVLSQHQRGEGRRPPFPDRTSVGDTLTYMGHFIPIAAVVAVTELVLPLTVWIYVFIAHYWDLFREEQAELAAPPAAAMDERPRALHAEDDPEGPERQGTGSVRAPSPPRLESEPIDGPHGWSGRSRFNRHAITEGEKTDDR